MRRGREGGHRPERHRVFKTDGQFTAGDRDGATEVFYKYLPIIRFENQPRINLALRKHIYHLRGVIASSRVRSPFTPVDADTLADLDDILARLELLGSGIRAQGSGIRG